MLKAFFHWIPSVLLLSSPSYSWMTMTRIMPNHTPSMRTSGHYHSIVVVHVRRYNESSDSVACQWRNELCSPSDGLWWAEDVCWRAAGIDLLIGRRRTYRADMHVKLSVDRCYVQPRRKVCALFTALLWKIYFLTDHFH